MAIPTVKIIATPERPSWAEVYIDGMKIDGVVSLETRSSYGEPARVTLDIICNLETETYQENKNGNPET